MKGSHRVIVQNNKLKYDFVINRNITIIRGNSASGKTTLINLIKASEVNAAKISCDVECLAFSELRGWDKILPSYNNMILFFDESCTFVKSKEFASIVKRSSCYFVIIARRDFPSLPYSINEIYEIREGKHYGSLIKENTLKGIFSNDKFTACPDIIITEDDKSGYQFFKEVFSNKPCLPSSGNSNVPGRLNSVLNNKYKSILVVVDGAAFGAFINKLEVVMIQAKLVGVEVNVLARESFEHIILMSDIIYPQYKNDIDGYEDNIECSKFYSWERYFTKLLVELTTGSFNWYQKEKLNPYYLSKKCIESILNEIGCIKVN